jgi:hypothetical protein
MMKNIKNKKRTLLNIIIDIFWAHVLFGQLRQFVLQLQGSIAKVFIEDIY